MDLRSGTPYWLTSNPSAPSFPPLTRDLKVEAAVIGGGITGALVAYHLIAAGVQTVVLDKRPIGYGSTAASTSLLLYELDIPLCELAQNIGAQDAATCYRLGIEALDRIEQIVSEVGQRCGFARRKSFYMAESKADFHPLLTEYRSRRKYGFVVDFLESVDIAGLFPFRRPAALLSHQAAEVDSLQLAHAVICRPVEAGLEVYAQTEVVNYEPGRDGVVFAHHCRRNGEGKKSHLRHRLRNPRTSSPLFRQAHKHVRHRQ
ncbi:MAG: NAD(P)/FAD-dependent oxidoreductase [Verrucomicrobiales bacterium]